MNLEVYERDGHHLYAALAATVASIVTTVAGQQREYRVQQVQNRAKGIASIAQKLTIRGVAAEANIDGEIKDLAGCRVILYTNADVARFISSGVIGENFEVDWARTKFHYPMQEPTAEEGFISYNYVVRLKANRLALPEYAQFAGLACEVQVQTTLDHAWSEMAHDTIYKPPPAGFGSAVIKGVSDRMTEIIQKYLRPAGFDFQKIAADVRAMEKGRALFEQDPLKLLAEAADNNERYRLLDEFEQHVVPNYDDLPGLAPAIREAMVATIKKARATPKTPLVLEGMSLSGFGYDAEQCFSKALEVIERLRFTSIEAIDATFNAICDLYLEASDRERTSLFRSLERLAQHNMDIWRTAGPLVEQRLLKLIEDLPEARRIGLRPILIKTLRQVLQPNITGTTSTYDQVQFHTGGVVPSDTYLTLRRDAISILQELLLSSTEVAEQREILHAFSAAARFPDHGPLASKLVEAVYADTASNIAFVQEAISQLPFEVLQSYEHDLVWKYRQSSALPFPHRENLELDEGRERLRAAILSFRDRLNSDSEFVIYKTLVGFESVFPLSWKDDGLAIQEEAEFRDAQIKRLVGEISEETFALWLGRIRRCARTKSNDGATFPSFCSFLVELGRRQPELLIRILENLDNELDLFVSAMLQGLEGGPLETQMLERARAWLNDGRHVLQVIAYCDLATTFDPGLLEAALQAAIKTDDSRSVEAFMGVCVHRGDKVRDRLNAAFATAVAHFVARGETRWVNDVWFRVHGNDFIGSLPHATRDEILRNLTDAPEVDYHTEIVLFAAAGTEPLKLLQFFHDRLRRGDERKDDERYEAVPFQLNRLAVAFTEFGRQVVERGREWFDEDGSLFEYRGGRLIHQLYPEITGVEEPLVELARTGDELNVKFLIAVLRCYQGASSTLPLWREVIAQLDSKSPLLKEIDYALDLSGVVSGEFGFVELHQGRRVEMEAWLLDEDERVRLFAEGRLQRLNLVIASEQRRASEQLELRKRYYGE